MQRPRIRRVRALRAASVLVVTLTVAFAVFQRVAQPAEPTAFYEPPMVAPDAVPGTLLRSEPVLPAVPGERAWRVLYVSTDRAGNAIAVSGVVVAPDRTAPSGGWPVLAWAHGTTGIASRCAPSLETGGGVERVPEHSRIVSAGTVVAITDYPGLGTPGPHPYLDGPSEGRAVLDSIRAARNLLGDATGGTAAVFGHSQGGHAALFAGALAAAYAPDVHLVGVAALAPPTDLATLLRDDRHEAAGILLTALAVASWAHEYPGLHAGAVVHHAALPLVDHLAERCVATTAQGLTDVVDVTLLRAGLLAHDPATVPGWKDRLAENSPGSAGSAPVLVAQGLADTMVRPEVTERYVRDQCAAGASIELDTYRGAGHFAVRDVAAPAVVSWLLDRLAALPAPTGCSTTTHPTTPEETS